MRTRMILAAALVLGSSLAASAEPSVDAVRRCAQVKDSLERLVCYDRAAAGSAGAEAAPAASPVAPAPAPLVRATPAPAPQAAPVQREFGDETVKRSEKERASTSGPSSLTAVVSELKEYRRNVYMLTLDNGQVWQQMDMDSLFQVKAGDTIQIEKGKLGGYRMARTSGGRSGWVRVNRVR
ncbi:MAG: hypothetical protein ABW278_01790 [Steroidobacteraceae bacterium]